jgi:PilZ domain
MDASLWSRRPHLGLHNRRNESREHCTGDVVIDILAPHPRRGVSAKVADVGDGGLKLKVPFFLTPGSILRLHLTHAVAQAEVKYCSCESAGFHVGVAVEEVSSDSQQK